MTAVPAHGYAWPTIGLTRLTSRPAARARLYCVPPSGAGPYFFQPWVPILPETVDLSAADLPGRGARSGEPSITDMRLAAIQLADLIAADLDRDRASDGFYALFGHSFGGLLAFETARRLRRAHGTQPNLLAVSGNPAPHLNGLRRYLVMHLGAGIGVLAQAALGALAGAAEPADPSLAEESLLAETVYTPFMADAVALLQHTHHDEPPLNARISVFGAHDDPIAPPESLPGWALHTTTGANTHLNPGDHQYLHAALPAVITQLTADLLQALRHEAG